MYILEETRSVQGLSSASMTINHQEIVETTLTTTKTIPTNKEMQTKTNDARIPILLQQNKIKNKKTTTTTTIKRYKTKSQKQLQQKETMNKQTTKIKKSKIKKQQQQTMLTKHKQVITKT